MGSGLLGTWPCINEPPTGRVTIYDNRVDPGTCEMNKKQRGDAILNPEQTGPLQAYPRSLLCTSTDPLRHGIRQISLLYKTGSHYFQSQMDTSTVACHVENGRSEYLCSESRSTCFVSTLQLSGYVSRCGNLLNKITGAQSRVSTPLER